MTNDQIHAIDLPAVELSDFKRHPKRFLKKKLIAKFLFFIPLLIAVIVLGFIIEEFWIFWAALGLWVFLFALGLFISYKEYFVRGYVLREYDITYRHGWMFHHETTVPFNRIQHTEIKDGPIDRLFTLCELEIYTAGGSASDLNLSGLDPEDAARLKEYIAGKTVLHA
ncbi:PH domain-containing protein [Nonlabens antarcticus]|uniref:PH domain-containing protein n=1 Tax=Nonlabens antarcticus TaxID=392714 RepID=UPI001890B96D|nr:PH domain-containing protein [Nonlabens antarcticus]